MRLRSLSLLLTACALSGAASADAKGHRVEFNGCVRQIVLTIGSCTYVGPYNISEASPQPNPAKRLGISGSGLRSPPSATCGGKRLTNVHWTYNKMSCPVYRRP